LRVPAERTAEVRVCSSAPEGTGGVGGGFGERSGLRLKVERSGCKA
jgi:hypothetical protein